MLGRANPEAGSHARTPELSSWGPASAGPFGLPKTSFEVVAVFTFKSRQARVEQFALGDDDDVKARRDLVTPEYFSDQPLRPIPLDRSTQPFCGGDPQAADCQ